MEAESIDHLSIVEFFFFFVYIQKNLLCGPLVNCILKQEKKIAKEEKYSWIH